MRQFVGESVKQSHSRHSRFPTRSGWPSNHLHLLLQAVRGRQGNWMKVKKWSLTPAEWWDFSSNSVPSDNLLHAGSLHTWHAGTIGPSNKLLSAVFEKFWWGLLLRKISGWLLSKNLKWDAGEWRVCLCLLASWVAHFHASHLAFLNALSLEMLLFFLNV